MTGKFVAPYIKVPLSNENDLLPIARVVCAPGGTGGLARAGVRSILQKFGYDVSGSKDGVRVKKSKIPNHAKEVVTVSRPIGGTLPLGFQERHRVICRHPTFSQRFRHRIVRAHFGRSWHTNGSRFHDGANASDESARVAHRKLGPGSVGCHPGGLNLPQTAVCSVQPPPSQ